MVFFIRAAFSLRGFFSSFPFLESISEGRSDLRLAALRGDLGVGVTGFLGAGVDLGALGVVGEGFVVVEVDLGVVGEGLEALGVVEVGLAGVVVAGLAVVGTALVGLEEVVEAALVGLEDNLGSSSTIISISDSWNRDCNKCSKCKKQAFKIIFFKQ